MLHATLYGDVGIYAMFVAPGLSAIMALIGNSTLMSCPFNALRKTYRYSAIILGSLSVAAAGPAAWWVAKLIMMDTATFVTKYGSPNYMIAPLDISSAARTITGFASVGVVGIWAFVALGPLRNVYSQGRWMGIVASPLCLAVYSGIAYAVITAPAIGANIGGAALIMLMPPMVIGMIWWYVVTFLKMRTIRAASKEVPPGIAEPRGSLVGD